MTTIDPNMTIRQALRAIRQDLVGCERIAGYREYTFAHGTIHVVNTPAAGGGQLLGVFEARLLNADGTVARTYRV